MLVAAGVLFYVSYWLVSQAQAKRWTDFLKQKARRGLEWGGGATLAVTAFLAVYREGAETALMYQALLGSQGTTAGRPAGPGRRLGPGPGDPGGHRRAGARHQRPAAVPRVLPALRAVPLRPGRHLRRQRRLRAPERRHPADHPPGLAGRRVPAGRALPQRPGRLGPGAAAGRRPAVVARDPRGSLGDRSAARNDAARPAPRAPGPRSRCRPEPLAIPHEETGHAPALDRPDRGPADPGRRGARSWC